MWSGLQTNGQQQHRQQDSAPAVAAQQQPPKPPEQLTADLRQQDACNVKPQLELQLGPQEMQVLIRVSQTAHMLGVLAGVVMGRIA
jgi:hypothetical protein